MPSPCGAPTNPNRIERTNVSSGACSSVPAGTSWGPVVLLVLSSASFGVFKTHAWPGGPIAFGAQAAAAAWMRWSAV